MGEDSVSLAVTPVERRIISGLRDLPPSPLRDLLAQVMVALIELVRQPQCPELQADGAPCTSPAADCAECAKLKEILSSLANRLPRS
jgi:hypothetical protein